MKHKQNLLNVEELKTLPTERLLKMLDEVFPQQGKVSGAALRFYGIWDELCDRDPKCIPAKYDAVKKSHKSGDARLDPLAEMLLTMPELQKLVGQTLVATPHTLQSHVFQLLCEFVEHCESDRAQTFANTVVAEILADEDVTHCRELARRAMIMSTAIGLFSGIISGIAFNDTIQKSATP